MGGDGGRAIAALLADGRQLRRGRLLRGVVAADDAGACDAAALTEGAPTTAFASSSWSWSSWTRRSWYRPGEWVLALGNISGGWWHARIERHLVRDRVLVRWHLPKHPDWHELLDEVEEWRVCRDPKEWTKREDWVENSWDFPLSRFVTADTLDGFCVHANSWRSWPIDALRVFQRNGFVVVRGAFSLEGCEEVLEACREAEADLRSHNTSRPGSGVPAGSRGAGRWSFGVASKTRSMLHVPAWARLLDCEPMLEVLDLVMPNGGTCTSSGGDFVEGRVGSSYQPLHSDLAGWDLGPFNVSFPPPCVSANFVVHPVVESNGPMRILPGTQRHSATKKAARNFWDAYDGEEPQAWRESTLQPLSPGDVIIRDVRVLHGGTPNHSDATRFLPAVEFVFGSYKDSECYDWDEVQHLPTSIFETLSERAQLWCGGVVGPQVDAGWI